MPRGIPKAGKRAPGAGRKPLGPSPLVKVTVAIRQQDATRLRTLGNGNLSAGLRRLLERTA